MASTPHPPPDDASVGDVYGVSDEDATAQTRQTVQGRILKDGELFAVHEFSVDSESGTQELAKGNFGTTAKLMLDVIRSDPNKPIEADGVAFTRRIGSYIDAIFDATRLHPEQRPAPEKLGRLAPTAAVDRLLALAPESVRASFASDPLRERMTRAFTTVYSTRSLFEYTAHRDGRRSRAEVEKDLDGFRCAADMHAQQLAQSLSPCTVCKSVSTRLKRCAGCGERLYCSKGCQMRDWHVHRSVCPRLDK